MRNDTSARIMTTVVVVIVTAMIGLHGPARAQAAGSATADPAAKPSRHTQARAGAARQDQTAPIICTKRGCRPLPAHCHAETEFTWDGDPTGYQIIVCP